MSVIESVFGNPSDFRREIHVKMKRNQYVLFLLLVGLGATGMKAQEAKYLPLSEYMCLGSA